MIKTIMRINSFLLMVPLLLSSSLYKTDNTGVKIWCVQQDSTISVRIENLGASSCYIPKKYVIQYHNFAECVYFESVYKNSLGEDSLYFYSKFSNPIITPKRLEELSYDSVKSVKYQSFDLQFRPPDMIEIKSKRSYLFKINGRLPRYLKYAIFKVYKKDYISNNNKNYLSYHSFNNFLNYESLNSIEVRVNINTAINE